MTTTPAIAFLRTHGVLFTEHVYEYVENGGTKSSSKALGVAEHNVIKTLVMEDESRNPLIVLMHGDYKVSTKNLARQIGKRSVTPCTHDVAERHTGYQIGGTSPFATRKSMPIYVEQSVLALSKIYINGGRRGVLVELDPQLLTKLVNAHSVSCGLYA